MANSALYENRQILSRYMAFVRAYSRLNETTLKCVGDVYEHVSIYCSAFWLSLDADIMCEYFIFPCKNVTDHEILQ